MSRQMAEQLCLLSAWACMTKDFVFPFHVPDLLYGLVNCLLLITPLFEMFREILGSFLKSIIIRADGTDA